MKNKKYILSLIILGVSVIIGVIFTSLSEKNKLLAQETKATRAISENIFQGVDIYVPSEKNRVLEEEDYLQNDSEVLVSMIFKFTNKDYKTGDTFVTTLPEGLTYKEIIEGDLSGTASYKIDPATRKLTLTLTQDVQSAEYNLTLTTRINYDVSLNSKQQLLFETQTPVNYRLHLYAKYGVEYKYGKTFDADGNETTLMPAKGGAFSELNVNAKHIDLSSNTLLMTLPTRALPSDWSDGYVNITQDINSYKFYTYETTINGDRIGDKKELKINEDFTVVSKSVDSVRLKFNERFHEALEVSGGEMTFDYSDFNPISNGKNGSIKSYAYFYIYPGETTANSLATSCFVLSFRVVELGYLGLGTIVADKNVKEKESIVKTPIYINGTNQQLKKGDTFVLTNEGDPVLVAIDTKLAQEYSVTLSENGTITEGTKKALSNWKISSDAYGKITLTYLGEDTTETLGLDIYVGRIEVTTNWTYNTPFILSGNGYQTTGKSTFVYADANVKSGSFNTAKNVITWTATVNSLYQKIAKLTDTFGYGVKAGTLKNLTISSVEFGANGTKKQLVEDTDYKVVDNSDGFEIKLLKETKEKLTISYETDVDFKTVNTSYSRAMNTITPTLQFASSDEKEYPTEGFVYIPSYLITNSPYLLGKNSSTKPTERLGQQPVNRVKLLINPNGSDLVNNEVIANYGDLDVVDESFTVNKMEQISTSDYAQLLPGAEITASSEDYPEITIENNQIHVKNKKLTQPIIVSFTLAKNNYYDVSYSTVYYSQTTNGSDPVNFKASLYFADYLPSSFSLKTSPNYTNIGEGILKINKREGSALIKGTTVSLGTISTTAEIVSELRNLREVTDGDGNALPADTVYVSNTYSNWFVRINDDQLDNGLIVKMNWKFSTSGTKSYQSGGTASHPYGTYSTANYMYANWSGKFDIDNSGAGGNGALILTDLTINMVDSVTNAPVAGATYEIIDKAGKLINTATADSKGQILLKDCVVGDYTLKEIKAPDGYLSNEEYNDSGQKITLSNTEANKLTISYVKEGKITVHFTYQDGTNIEAIEPITITGGNGATINLKEQEKVKEQLEKMNAAASDYHFLSYDQGAVAGTEEAAVIPYDSGAVYYKYEGLLTLRVPELMTFETGFVSPFTQTLSYENQDDFEVSLRDSRQITSSTVTKESKTRGNIRLNASLSKEFKTSQNKVLRNAQLYYQNGANSVLLNGAGGELVNNRQDAANPSKKDFTFILDTSSSKSEGFKLEVPAKGTLAEEYTGEVTWEIIQEP
ncbi:hypothetical protein GIX45_25415 [Erwinia sp. CPCC 100877]|nr:hypothetical protein [Erwinia sp. CPCC 100877]